MDVNDTLIEAINILIKSALEKAEFDKTIKATILYKDKNNSKLYKCDYQGATITASNLNNNEYIPGDVVYILDPATNNNGTGKIILGKT